MIRPPALCRLMFLAALIDFILISAGTCRAESDGSQWRFRRSISVDERLEGGLYGLALFADLLEHCRPDLKDVRISRTDEGHVPGFVWSSPRSHHPPEIPVVIRRINTVSGTWTDIVIDKSSKVNATGVRLETDDVNFVRRVEISGWDEESETYVVRMDGLIAHAKTPFPLKVLDVFHPTNTFRYLKLRIHEDGQGPLRIDRIKCYGYDGEANCLNNMKPRVVESSSGIPAGASRLVFDLGEKRLPLARLSISSGNTEFSKKAILYGTSQKENAAWNLIYEGIFFRIRRGHSYAEQVSADIPSQLFRYYKLELSGDGPEVPLERVDCLGQAPLLIFHHEQGAKYYLSYGNADQVETPHRLNPESPGSRVPLLDTSEVSWGPEERNPSWKAIVQETPHQGNSAYSKFARIGLVTLLLVLLLVIFWGMLKKGPLARKR